MSTTNKTTTTETEAVRERFPVVAMRLLLNEYARIENKSGYVRLATSEDEPGTTNTWSVRRTDPVSGDDGKVKVPALVILTVERERVKRMQAFSDLRKANSEIVTLASKFKGLELNQAAFKEPTEAAARAAELLAVKDTLTALQDKAEALARYIESPNTTDFYFPVDCPFKEFPLAALSL